MEFSDIKSKVPSIVLALSFSALTACGGGAGGSVASNIGCEGGTTCGELDDVQAVIADTLGGKLASALPAPLGPVVGCTSNVVNNVVDVPDALLVGIEGLAASQNPDALLSAFSDMGTSFGNAAFNLQGALTTLAGSESSCAEAGSGSAAGGVPSVPGIPSGETGGPTGTPLDLALAPLVDGLNTLVETLQGAADGTPAAAAIDPVVEGLDALLAVLNGGGAGDIPELPALPGGGANPLTDVLSQLQGQLAGFADGGAGGTPSLPSFPGMPTIPDGSGGTDLDMVPVTDVLASVTDAISLSIGQGRSELETAAGSEVPVIGGLLLTLETALSDTSTLLDAVGSYNGAATNAALEALLENVLGNVLTQVIPLELIGEQAGQDLAGPVRDGIAQGVSALGNGTGLVIGPVFSTAFGDAATPALDPIEAILSQLLAASPVDLGDTLSGGIAQLVAALTDLSGGSDALPGAGDLPALPSGGANPLDALLGGLPAVGGDLPSSDGPTGTPLDLLLGALVDNDPTGQLAGLLSQLTGPLLGLLAQLQALAP